MFSPTDQPHEEGLGQNTRLETILCVGVPKSGTSSIAGIFNSSDKDVAHELERADMVTFLHRHKLREVCDDSLVHWHRARREKRCLDLESNCFLTYRFDLLVRAFPQSKVILPVRFPKPWLKSILNNNIRFRACQSEIVAKYHEVLFDPKEYSFHPTQEALLKKWELYPIDAYLHYWKTTYESIIDSVPCDRLYILETNDIGGKVSELHAFAGWDFNPQTQTVDNCHLNAAPHDYGILEMLDENFVNTRIEIICAPTVQRIKSLLR